MELLNLQELGLELQAKFEKEFKVEDLELPAAFKKHVNEIGGNKLNYKQYMVHMSTTNLNSYIPNSWFYIASYFVSYYDEVIKYKDLLISTLKKCGLNKAEERDELLTKYTKTLDAKVKEAKKNKLPIDIDKLRQEVSEEVRQIIHGVLSTASLDKTDCEYLEKFVSDYTWWYGGKTIDRGDFYFSPILTLAKVVNASSSYIADLCKFLSENKDATILLRYPNVVTCDNKLPGFFYNVFKHLYDRQNGLKLLFKYIVPGSKDSPRYKFEMDDIRQTNFFVKGEDAFNSTRKGDFHPSPFIYKDEKYYLSQELAKKRPANNNEVSFDGLKTVIERLYPQYKLIYEYSYYILINMEEAKDLGPLQQIFYGAPGTGKSHKVDEMCKAYSNHRTTFHPDSDYSTFVGCYKPTKVKVDKKPLLNFNELADKLKEYRTKDNETNAQVAFGYDYYQSLREVDNLGKLLLASGGAEYDTYLSAGMLIAKKEEGTKKAGDITYSFTPQAFTNAYVEAWQKFEKNEPVLLVIEEINRGNCAQIFGDLFQLLDRNEDGYSTYPIEPDTDLGTYISEQGLNVQKAILKKKDGTTEDISGDINQGKKLVLPPNLYIWATMNTSDQSLFPIDSAFKRRWDWKYVPIRDKKEENYKIETVSYLFDWWDFLTKVNLAIGEATSSEDKKLGYFFCKGDKKGRISTDKFVSKVLFYLWTDVFKDYEADEVKFTHEGKDYELLQYKTKEGEKESIHKFSFSDFFTEDGDGNPSMVEKFLMNIEVLKEEKIKEGKEVEDGGSDEEGATTGTFQADSKIPK